MRIIQTASGWSACIAINGAVLTARGETREEALDRLKDMAESAYGVSLALR